jgi:hypothetical protein
MRRNKHEETKGNIDKKNLSADGAAFTIGKSNRSNFAAKPGYGKDGKEPPHTYLNIREWMAKGAKKSAEDRSKTAMRKTYIDEVCQYHQKHKYPGPEHYFKEQKKKEKTGGKVLTKEEIKKLVRPSFLDDHQYLSMNNPAPGTYNPAVFSF